MKLPALRAVVPAENGGDDVTPLSSFFFRPPQSLKTASPLSGVRQGWDHPCSQGGHTGRTWPAAFSTSPVLSSPPKPHTTPHRRQRLALLLTALALDSRRFMPFSESLLLFFTAAQFLLVPPLEILTQNVTQNTENSCGADRNDLRVFGDFRPKKARKALGRSGLTTRPQHMYMIFSCLCFDYLYSLYSHKLFNICLVSCFIFPYMTCLPHLGANAI